MKGTTLGRPAEAKKPPQKELPSEAHARFEQKLEAYRRAWEDSRDPCAVVDAMWLTENLQQPVPSWLKKATAKFPADMGLVNVMRIQASVGPRGTPQRHWGPFQFAQYAIQTLHPNVSGNVSRRKLVKDVVNFLKTDRDFRGTGLEVPSRRAIERALNVLRAR